jgi:hypothetical protein
MFLSLFLAVGSVLAQIQELQSFLDTVGCFVVGAACVAVDNPTCGGFGTCVEGTVKEIRIIARYNLTGRLPSSMAAFTGLERLDVSGHGLTGPVNSTGLERTLVVLNLASNVLDGKLPNLRRFAKLKQVILGGNNFTGDLSDLGDLSSLDLTVLALANLSAISESRIPALNWKELRFLNLQSSKIIGTLPSELSEATLLGYLIAYSNAINGSVPSLRALTKLSRLDLAGNALTGQIEFPEPRDANLTSSCDVGQNNGCLCPSGADRFCECGCGSTGATLKATTAPPITTTQMVSSTTAKTSSIATSTSNALASETPPPLGAIIGGAIGGVCLVLAFAAAVLWWRRRSNQPTASGNAASSPARANYGNLPKASNEYDVGVVKQVEPSNYDKGDVRM